MSTKPIVIRVRIKDRKLYADFRREAVLQGKFVEDLAAEALSEYLRVTNAKRRPSEETSAKGGD
jgi:hypothetical protein